MATRVDVVRAVRELPALATVAANALRVLDDPRSSATQVGDLIAADPSLLVNLLRVANSPMLGRSRITQPGPAVALVGWSGVRAVITSAALRLSAPGPDWQHALTTASCAALLADQIDQSVVDAFTAGLLHDVGRAVYRELHGTSQPRPDLHEVTDLEAEQARDVLDHAEFGRIALQLLSFPEVIVDAVGNHHDEAGVAGRPLASVVCAANHLAHVVDGPEPSPLRMERLGTALVNLGRSEDDVDDLVRRSKELAAEYAALALG